MRLSTMIAADVAKRERLDEIMADPACARPEELTACLVDKVLPPSCAIPRPERI